MFIPKIYCLAAIAAISKGPGASDNTYRTRFSGASDRVNSTARLLNLNFSSQLKIP